MRRRIAIFILAAIAMLSGCEEQTGSEAFLPPEIVEAVATVEGTSVRFQAVLSEPRAERCGFRYGVEGEPMKEMEATLDGTSFELVAEDLVRAETYSWEAFATAGESEVRSQTACFTLDPLPPEDLVEIPDQAFKEYLVSSFDKDGDGEISLSEALAVRRIAVRTDEIFSLDGIEHFRNIDTLICRGVDPEAEEYGYSGRPGRLMALDLSSNTRLRHLECDGNYIETLILPESPWLEFLRCSKNTLKELDLSCVPYLRKIQAFDNELTSLDFSCNPNLESIEIGDNQMTSVDVTCCPKLGVLNLSDLNIKELDLSGCPKLGWLGIYGTDITSIDLSHTPKLEYLNCQDTMISSLDLSPCLNLFEIKCWKCKIEELDISMLPRLEIVECAPMNTLKKLYVSDTQVIEGVTHNRSEANVPAETEIVVRYAGAPDGKILFEDACFKAYLVSVFDTDGDGEISLEEAEEIYRIEVWSDEWNITSLQGIEFMPNLETLRCCGTWIGTTVLNRPHYYTSKHYHWDECVGPIGTLKNVDVSKNHKLKVLNLENNSGIGETGTGTIDLSNNPLLEELWMPMCYLKYPDVSVCEHLRILNLSHDRGVLPDLTHNPELVEVHFDFNQQENMLQHVDVSKNPLLEHLDVGASASSLSDLSLNPKLKCLKYGWCGIHDLDLFGCQDLEELDCQSNDLSRIDVSGLKHLKQLCISGNPIGYLDVSGLSGLESLQCSYCQLSELDLEAMPKLTYLECQWNRISSLDLTQCPQLKEFSCAGNPILSLDLSANRALERLYCDNTYLTGLDVSHNPVLGDLRCNDNDIENLDVSSNVRLMYLYFERCKISSIDLSGNPELREFDCTGNNLTEIDLSKNPFMRWLICKDNLIEELDVSNNPCLSGTNDDQLTGLFCAPMNDAEGNNLLRTLWVSSSQTAIPGVTRNRSSDCIPNETEIKVR